ncbi:hypothetical protein HMPREF9603_01322 [Cutibacterium acnes HL001PA1]|nr:hypothetical protein HMPREF9603_01322 [Cutibacterium acnes HL001PA1]
MHSRLLPLDTAGARVEHAGRRAYTQSPTGTTFATSRDRH